MSINMKRILAALLMSLIFFGCQPKERLVPEPHLELGQKVTFVGSEPEETYVIVGYRELYESETQKDWNSQDYIVFVYITDQNEVKEGTVHRNSIMKK